MSTELSRSRSTIEAGPAGKQRPDTTMAELPIACTLTPEALRTRREGLLMDLVRRAVRREDLSDGLRLEFAPSGETLALIARAVEAERHCCRFLRFGMSPCVTPGVGDAVDPGVGEALAGAGRNPSRSRSART